MPDDRIGKSLQGRVNPFPFWLKRRDVTWIDAYSPLLFDHGRPSGVMLQILDVQPAGEVVGEYWFDGSGVQIRITRVDLLNKPNLN